MTLEKLLLRILINDVRRRIFVMHTKMNWMLVSGVVAACSLRDIPSEAGQGMVGSVTG